MHENIYADLISFALVFDRVSLYAVSGMQLDRYFPLGAEGFLELISIDNPPFFLTAPSDFYEKEVRKARLNQDVMGWHDFDDWAVREFRGRIVSVQRSPKIRTTASDLSRRYRDRVRGLLGNNERVSNAYNGAKAQYEIELGAQKAGEDVKSSRKFILPATFRDTVRHSPLYQEMLSDGDVLPLLLFEHLTKPAVIKSIQTQLSDREEGAELDMYVPDLWHRWLMDGLSHESAAKLIPDRHRVLLECLDSEGATIVDAFRTLHLNLGGGEAIQLIAKFRKGDGPQLLRRIAARYAAEFAAVSTPDARKNAARSAIRRIDGLVSRLYCAEDLALPLSLMLAGLALLFGRDEISFVTAVEGPAVLRPLLRQLILPTNDQAEMEMLELLLPLFRAAQPKQVVPPPMPGPLF